VKELLLCATTSSRSARIVQLTLPQVWLRHPERRECATQTIPRERIETAPPADHSSQILAEVNCQALLAHNPAVPSKKLNSLVQV
jgi:hypothetical protein